MSTRMLAPAAVLALVTACGSPTGPGGRASEEAASPPSLDRTELGTPGAANCRGQTQAFVAQFGKTIDGGFRGTGGAARNPDELTGDDTPISVAALNEAIVGFCNRVP